MYPRDCISNLCDFLNGNNYISDHTYPITKYNKITSYFNRLKYKCYPMENGFSEKLYRFFKKYHLYEDGLERILDKKDNSILEQNNRSNKLPCMATPEIKYFDESQWKAYMEQYNIDYDVILEDEELRQLIVSPTT
jgi:hypothetical protein